MNATLIEQAAEFVANTSFDSLPDIAVSTATLGFTDTVAALIAGRREPVTEIVRRYLLDSFGNEGRRVKALLGEIHLQAEHAALLDATAAHSLDYDDYAFANHPSSIMVPAILAASQIAAADGPAMCTAYAVGYEVWAEIMAREPDHLHSKGWHPTAVFGPIGAAAAVASILGLSTRQTADALGLAVAHSGGVMANFGSMAKPYHAGRAAEAGLRTCFLAARGMSANVNAIDGETGLLAALSPKGNADLESLARFGETWRVCETGLNVKKYPTVGASQRIIDALLGLPSPVDLEAIEVVRPRVSEKYARLMHYMDPKTPAHAKFSLSFACAAALRFGKVSLKELDDEALQDPVLRSLIRRVEVDAVDEYDPNYPVPAPYDMVTLVMKDGAIVETQKVRRATGHADRPLSFQQMQDKFLECAAYGGVSPTQAEVLFRRLQQLPQLDNVAAVFLFE